MLLWAWRLYSGAIIRFVGVVQWADGDDGDADEA